MMADGTIMDGPVHGPGQECVEYEGGHLKKRKGGTIKNPRYRGNGKKTARQYSAGGMLVGPSHEQGGIQAIVDGTEPIEMEGGEFVINKQTVDAVGEEFLHKLNSTETNHHTGGYNEGQLPSPSQYKDGGKVNRRNKMARGRRAPRRGRAPVARRKMAAGGRACGGRGQAPCGRGTGGGYQKGGRTRPVRSRKMARGGGTRKMGHGGSHFQRYPNSACKSISSKYECQKNGCRWDFQNFVCG